MVESGVLGADPWTNAESIIPKSQKIMSRPGFIPGLQTTVPRQVTSKLVPNSQEEVYADLSLPFIGEF